MARIRTIKPEFWSSEQVVECSTTARLLFIGLWNFCDDGGVHTYSIKRIKMQIFPGDEISDREVAALVDELLKAGLLRSFTVASQQYLWVSGWHHQKIEKPTIRFPQPDDSTKFDDGSTTPRRIVDDASPPEGKGRESKGCNTPCSPPRGTRARGKRFQKPTLAQLADYCLGRDNGIDPQDFLDHYETNGWRCGKNLAPMSDWKAAIRTWEAKRRKEQPPSRVVTPEEYAEMITSGEVNAMANGRAER